MKKRRYELRFRRIVFEYGFPGIARRMQLRDTIKAWEFVYAYLVRDRLTGEVLKDTKGKK